MRWCTSPTSAAAPGMGSETGEPVSGGTTAYECRVADEAGDLLAGRQLVFSIAGFGPTVLFLCLDPYVLPRSGGRLHDPVVV